jgi:hypothetical protein
VLPVETRISACTVYILRASFKNLYTGKVPNVIGNRVAWDEDGLGMVSVLFSNFYSPKILADKFLWLSFAEQLESKNHWVWVFLKNHN